MMWPSQNFLLHIGAIMKYSLKKINLEIPFLLRYMVHYHVQIIATYYYSKKQQTISMSAKYNDKNRKLINLLSSKRFPKAFLIDIPSIFFFVVVVVVKDEKKSVNFVFIITDMWSNY